MLKMIPRPKPIPRPRAVADVFWCPVDVGEGEALGCEVGDEEVDGEVEMVLIDSNVMVAVIEKSVVPVEGFCDEVVEAVDLVVGGA
jgi:hypothetical protein